MTRPPSRTPPPPAAAALLGGLAPRTFLSRYWQKRPLLVRGAWRGFRDPVSVSDLFGLAGRDDCESRLVERRGERWHLRHGPFGAAAFGRLPRTRWTLLVHGLNHFVDAADRMLRAFAFIPYARLDDVMVSYAARGGGVGPHVDAYDVFLLQGSGRRRWRIATGGDRELDSSAPLRVLRRFRAECEWVLEPGDLLYLPPGVAHEGTALEPCFTYSIGFRAPSVRELGIEFLAFLQDRLALPEKRYEDSDLRPTRHPARLDDRFVRRAGEMIEAVRWSRQDITTFLGTFLSEPKQQIRFEPPARPLPRGAFARALARRGLALAPTTGMLYRGNRLFVNGETASARASARRVLARLADRRELPPGTSFTREALTLLYTWYRAGYLRPGGRHG
jgi:50S ribosomal protein L16 3-hydroxylase